MPFFTRVFRSKDSVAAKKNAKTRTLAETGPRRPKWTDAWQQKEIAAEEVQDLLRGCTQELKARGLDIPFLLLPFRPSSDPSAARTFIRNYFNNSFERGAPIRGDELMQELRLIEPMVLCSVLKWCWSRLPGGVVTWEAYELFKVGEQDSHLARDAFSTFIPISVDSDARTRIIFDFFDLLAAIAAHGKSNGLGGRKLSRYAGWWAFEHADNGTGFEAAYKTWTAAADATSHLFFAYLRSLSPDFPRGLSGISALPIALQTLVQATEYPPETPALLQISTTKVVMIVDTVSPTPFALLRRAKNFEYRDSDRHLQEFAGYEDPIRALTDECLRVLKCISSTNQSNVSSSKTSTSLRDASWSRFEDIGFGGAIDSDQEDEFEASALAKTEFGGLRSAPHSIGGDLGRPTTPSWADFLSSGFTGESGSMRGPGPLLLPPDKVLPPIVSVRGQSSQSHKRSFDSESPLDPGELASITTLDLDDSFWWVWISSLAGEEPPARKAVFGRCALLETIIREAKWLILEEQVKGAAPEPDPGAYLVEKKRFFGFTTRRGKLTRRKSTAKKATPVEESYKRANNTGPLSKTSIAPDQHARIQAAAAALQKKHREQEQDAANGRRTKVPDDSHSPKTASVLTSQPPILNEASHAMKWASNYDKNAYRTAYLSNSRAGTGVPAETLHESTEDTPETPTSRPSTTTRQAPPPPPEKDSKRVSSPLPPTPKQEVVSVKEAPLDAELTPKATPAPTPVASIAQSSTESAPKQSMESVEDPNRKLKKKPGSAGFKSMFGTNRKKNVNEPPLKPTGAEPSAVAAARAALEGKARAAQEPSPLAPKQAAVQKISKKPLPEGRIPTADSAAQKPAAPKAVEQAVAVAQVRPQHTPTFPLAQDSGPPRTRREEEYEALSRVGTAERTAADKEFSRFDQGPLLDQPAFVPEDSPVSPVSEDLPETIAATPEAPKQSIDIPANGGESVVEPGTNASYDRWAQIRKNAAERTAAHFDEASSRMSQTDRTDDGDTSGEETIESRVARIKARVAELTGNMEAVR